MAILLAMVLGVWPLLPAAAQEDEERSEETITAPTPAPETTPPPTSYPAAGGRSLNGTGISVGQPDTTPSPARDMKAVTQMAGEVSAGSDPSVETPCFDAMPTSMKLRGRGRLICWVAHEKAEAPETAAAGTAAAGTAGAGTTAGGQTTAASGRSGPLTVAGGAGTAAAASAQYNLKNVHQWSDGAFPTGEWYENAKRAFPGASLKFADETGDQAILQQTITGYRSVVTKYMSPGVGAYMDNSEPAAIPDEVHWTIEISGGYKWEFDHGNKRDCIFSGNGVTYLSGNGHTVTLPAQQSGEFRYKGRPVCLRCDANAQPWTATNTTTGTDNP